MTNHFQMLFLATLLTLASSAQLIPADSLKIYTQVSQEALLLKEQLNTKYRSYQGQYYAQLISFTVDTFKIERTAELIRQTEQSNAGMSIAEHSRAVGYETLANRLYYTLKENLAPEDKEVLVANYWKWKAMAESQRALHDVLAKDHYTGGGTIQNAIVASRNSEIKKHRALELWEYLGLVLSLTQTE